VRQQQQMDDEEEGDGEQGHAQGTPQARRRQEGGAPIVPKYCYVVHAKGPQLINSKTK
jgi:hypothetical protein